MNIKLSTLYMGCATSLGVLLWGLQAEAAVLQNGDILTITTGTPVLDSNGNTVGFSGSYFGMDTDGNGKIAQSEKTALAQGSTGIVIGITPAAGASHGGPPAAGDSNAFDAPWAFFGNTGSDYAKTTPITSVAGGLDMRGWTVTWNAIPAINMGGGAWQPGNCGALGCTGQTFTNGVGMFTWDGVYTHAYTLNHAATVPPGDPSGFGGVKYYLHLEGTVQAAPPPVVNPITKPTSGSGTLGAGPTSGANADGTIASASVPLDSGVAPHCVGGCFDYKITGVVGASVKVVLPLTAALPKTSVYRKYVNGKWGDFTQDANNTVASAQGAGTDGTAASCPVPGDAAYTPGLSPGYRCVQLTIADGGPNDADGAVNATVTDPSGVGIPATSIAASGHSGCSIATVSVDPAHRADWGIVGGFLAWMGVVARRKRHN